MPFRLAGVAAAGVRSPYTARLRRQATGAATSCLGAVRLWVASSVDRRGCGMRLVLR
jgi:hypothetical protein